MVEKSRQIVSVFACVWLITIIFGSVTFCAFSNNARAWGTEFVLEVTPTDFYQDTTTNVTIIVRDLSGNPVPNASIYFGILDINAYGTGPNAWTLAQYGPSLGSTDATGTLRTTYTPEYGTPMHLIITAENGTTECGYKEFVLGDEPGSEWDPMSALKEYGFIMACLIVVPVTLGGWYSSTTATKKRFENAKLQGFNKKVEDTKSSADPLKHPDSNDIFKSFKEGLRETKESKLFITNKLLKSFAIRNVNKHYAGVVRGDEEVEYPSTDIKEQRVGETFKLHADPKPTHPTKFVDEAQHYPISEKIDTCSRCSGTGTNKCKPCGGSGKVACNKCGASGRTLCYACNGAGYKEGVGGGTTTITVDSSGHETGWRTQGAGNTTHTTCSTCKGTGYVACGKCDGTTKMDCPPCHGTGNVICELCEGDRNTRHLTRKVWTYKHEKLRQVHGPDKLSVMPDRFEEIGKTIQNGPSLDDSAAAPTYPSEDGQATPFIRAIVDSSRNSYNKWKGRKKGKVILDKHDLLLSPVTGLEIEYPSKEGEKTFKVWALGNPKAYVLDAGETPTQLTARYAARHAAFAIVVLLEIAFFVYAIMYWHILL